MVIRINWKFEDKWEWNHLSSNKKIPWSEELIKKFEDRWNWDKLSSNKHIPWTLKLIETFEKKWNWEILSSNKYVFWDETYINKFSQKLIGCQNIWKNVKFYINEETLKKILDIDEIKEYEEHNIDPWEGQDYDAYLREEMNYTIEDSYRDGGGGDEWSDPEDFWG